MRILRYESGGDARHGLLRGDTVHPLSGDIFSHYRVDEHTVLPLDTIRLLAPVTPTKIVAVGINYRDHAEEFGHDIPDEPVLFMKPSSSVIGPGEPIRRPPSSTRVDFEAELAAVVGRKARGVAPADAADFVLGYTCLNDVTARDLQRRDGQWTRAKSFDTFCPLGPWIETDLDPESVGVSCRLNGELRQSSRTDNFIFPFSVLFSFVSGVMTLEPGDVITTGTPSGVGPMKAGDRVRVEVEGIGVLENPVVDGGP